MPKGNHKEGQRPIWLNVQALSEGQGHPLYQPLVRLLLDESFDVFVQECRSGYLGDFSWLSVQQLGDAVYSVGRDPSFLRMLSGEV
jgi:hypothetical protein